MQTPCRMSNQKQFQTANNHGALLIQSCQYDDAIHCCIRALQIVNETLTNSIDSCRSTPRLKGGIGASYLVNTETYSQESTIPYEVFVFQNPIIVSKDQENYFCTELSIVAMYNLALSYHLSALHRSCRKRLQQAVQYYESAFKSLLDETNLFASLAMAILNNIGHIHHILQNKEGAKTCFQHLLSTMLYVQELGGAKNIYDWDHLLSNAVSLVDSNKYAAGAA